MSAHFQSHLKSAIAILKNYKGEIPFHLFLKKYFSANKKFGSKDRKQIASLCYNYFRLGKTELNIPIEESILLSTFLCENNSSEFLKTAKPKWNDVIQKPLNEKISTLNFTFSIQKIFPFTDELSAGIDADKFNKSFLIQPKLFLRIRPGNKNKVTGKFAGTKVSYKLLSDDCIALQNASKINEVIKLDEEAVVQDYNSQRVGEFLKLQTTNQKIKTQVWDCCAASGGKSIMAYDINPNIQLTISDKRESILKILEERFAKAGIKNYTSFVADLSDPKFKIQNKKYDLIIADVPCTGSGTWARTPEQLYFFKQNKIEEYANLQKKILENVIAYLKPGGNLLYITCSVFKKENEEVINHATKKFNLKIEREELLKGYEMQADTMFAALLTAP